METISDHGTLQGREGSGAPPLGRSCKPDIRYGIVTSTASECVDNMFIDAKVLVGELEQWTQLLTLYPQVFSNF